MTAPDQPLRELATDTQRSVIVQAPAGSGKTTLLVTRYLKLLSRAEQPEQILAITFTRKAAGEMRGRVLAALRSAAPDARGALHRDAERGWQLLANPNRLKIQTIDSFAMTLARQLPITSALDPGATLVEDAGLAYAQACSATFARLYQRDPLAEPIAEFLALFGNDVARATRLVATMLARRDQWLDTVRAVVSADQDPTQDVAARLRDGLITLNRRVVAELEVELDATMLRELLDVTREANANLGVTPRDDAHLYRLLGETFTTQAGDLRRTLNKNQGFPTTAPELKRRATELLAQLGTQEAGPLLANLRFLPATELDPETVAGLMAICITLLLATLALDDLFRRQRSADFTQLLLAARAALADASGPTELALALDYRIRHLLVDEFQDTSVSQFQLFELLLQGWAPDDGNTFFAVGDPMQSIYRFRNAEVSLFYDAWHHGIAGLPLEQVRLTSNFRSHAGLVRWANESFTQIMGTANEPELGRIAYSPALPAREGDEPAAAATATRVTSALFETPADQVDAVVSRIQELIAPSAAGQSPAPTIALLVRGRRHLADLLPALRRAGVEWQATDIDPLATRPAVSDLLSLARALASPHDRLAWFSVLRAPWAGLSRKDLELLGPAKRFPDDCMACIDQLSPAGARRLRRCLDAYEASRHLQDEVPPRTLLETLWLRLGGADAYEAPASVIDAERLFELVDELGADGLDVEQLETSLARLYATDTGQAALQIMTVHKAKGLEFDHVILPFLERTTASSDLPLLLWRAQHPGLLMGFKGHSGTHDWLARENKAREAHELERVLYVACTRARDGLHLFATRDPDSNKPPSGSLLSRLWPMLDGLPIAPGTSKTDARADTLSAPAEAVTARYLPGDYLWVPPGHTAAAAEPSGAVTPGDDLPSPSGEARTAPDRLNQQPEIALGIVLHRTLQHLANRRLPDDGARYAEAVQPLWREQLQRLGVAPELHGAVLAELAGQLSCVLADADGRWLLGARRAGRTELAITAAEGFDVAYLDRTFLDDEGVRWVIDYKSARPATGQSSDEFIRAESARYRPQLARYAALARAAFPETVQVAMYFTALPELHRLTEL